MTVVMIESRAGTAQVILRGRVEQIQDEWRRGKFYEPRLLEYIYYRYKGGAFVDAGSAIGNHTIHFALFCGVKKVISIEPLRSSFEHQRDIVRLNGLDRVVSMYNCAVADKPGRCSLEQFKPFGLAQHRVVEGDDVEVRTLDDILEAEAVGRCTLVKADIEGHELKMLKGATQMLTHKRPGLFLEIRPKGQYRAITEYLAGFGYAQVGTCFQGSTVYEFAVK